MPLPFPFLSQLIQLSPPSLYNQSSNSPKYFHSLLLQQTNMRKDTALTSPAEIVLFGVRVKVDPMRKSVSMNNLSQYQHPDDPLKPLLEDSGYASADDALPNPSSASDGRCLKERKRGVPWTEEEHKLFLLGLQKVGKGDWRGISRNFVKTRTPTQVASHAQKYFLRRNNLSRRRRRSSLFDITTDSVSGIPMEECNDQEDNLTQQATLPVAMPAPETPSMASKSTYPATPFPVSFGQMLLRVPVQNPIETMTFGKADQANNGPSMLVHDFPVLISSSSSNVDLNLNNRLGMESTQLSLGLSLSLGQGQSSTRQSTFQLMSHFSNGDSTVSVA